MEERAAVEQDEQIDAQVHILMKSILKFTKGPLVACPLNILHQFCKCCVRVCVCV